MWKLKLLETKDKSDWTRIIDRLPNPDIYFTPEYAQIYEESYSPDIDESFCGKSYLCFYGDESKYLVYPLIKRVINELPFLKGANGLPTLYDVISPYGYSGPIFYGCEGQAAIKLLQDFFSNWDKYCKENGIVTEFIRFHPLLKNYEIFKEVRHVDERNQTVYLNLSMTEEELLGSLNKKTRNLMRKAEKNNVRVEITNDSIAMQEFTRLYLDTMQHNQAGAKYLFPLRFFQNSKEFLGGNISLFIARYEEKIISAALMMQKYNYMHYHFSGSDRNYLNFAPNNLLLWKAILWGKSKGYKIFHLGGGLSLSESDSLFHFKAGFSKNLSRFYTARIIHDEHLYDDLCSRRNSYDKKHEKTPGEVDFFPYYRKP